MRNFNEDEFSDFSKMKRELLTRLDDARDIAGVPFVLTSSHREGDDKSHGRGYAVDIRTKTSRNRFHIVRGLIEAGFRRIGIYDLHAHADCDPSLPDIVMWWGKSK
jgi:hypothetical protein